jgi:hypothetical protein
MRSANCTAGALGSNRNRRTPKPSMASSCWLLASAF